MSPITTQHSPARPWLVWLLAAASCLVLQPKPMQSAKTEQPAPLNYLAPELVGGPWLNTPGNAPISLASRRGKVTIVHFWTYGCYNCQNNLPAYARWHKQFGGKDVAIIGVHTPETPAERIHSNVTRHVKDFKIEYPVLFDQSQVNWERWQQRYWPVIYLVDKQGKVRFRWIGELNYGGRQGEARMAERIGELLNEPENFQEK